MVPDRLSGPGRPDIIADPRALSGAHVKLAILTSSLPPAPVGGAEHQALETARRLAARGHEITVFARRLPSGTPRVAREHGVTWVRSWAPGIPLLRFGAHAASFLRDWKAFGGPKNDLVLAYQMIINGFLASLTRTPMLTWIRDEGEARLIERPSTRGMALRVLTRSRRVLFQADGIRKTVLDTLESTRGRDARSALEARTDVLANGIALGPEPSREGRDDVLYLSRLYPQKGVDVLLEAMRRIPDPPPLRIVGDGPLRAALEEQARGLPVTFVGHVPLQSVRAQLERARFLVFPSRWEGFPNVILEAMDRGLAVVATDVGAVREIVAHGETGYVVPPGDPEALALRIRELWNDPDTADRMGRLARERVRAYDWERHLDRLEAILDASLAEERPAAYGSSP